MMMSGCFGPPSPTPIDPGKVIVVDSVPVSPMSLDETTTALLSVLFSTRRSVETPPPTQPYRRWCGGMSNPAMAVTPENIGCFFSGLSRCGGFGNQKEETPFLPNKTLETTIKNRQPSKLASEPNRLRALKPDQWFAKYEQLRQFKENHGHCLVPHNWSPNLKLAQWVKRQRHQYKLKGDGKHSTLSDDRQDLLEQLGFVWCSHNAMWEEKFEELKRYVAENGTCHVPQHHPKANPLATWVKSQRRQYRLYLKGEQNSISQHRMSKMTSIGFNWDTP